MIKVYDNVKPKSTETHVFRDKSTQVKVNNKWSNKGNKRINKVDIHEEQDTAKNNEEDDTKEAKLDTRNRRQMAAKIKEERHGHLKQGDTETRIKKKKNNT